MGALRDAYDSYQKKTAVPEIAAMPKSYAPAYYETMGKNVEVPRPVNANDISSAVSGNYKKYGGGIRGIGMGALAGIGKIGEFMGTEQGANIMAGLQTNPYLAEGYLKTADKLGRKEAGAVSAANQTNMELLKQRGEDVREAGKSAATAKQSQDNLILQNMLNEPSLAISQGQLALAGKREERETKQQEAVQKTGEVKTDYDQKVKPILDMANDLYAKKSISEANYAKLIREPLKYKVTSSAHKIFGIGPGAGITEGKLSVDANGNKAYVFPDGTINEVQ